MLIEKINNLNTTFRYLGTFDNFPSDAESFPGDMCIKNNNTYLYIGSKWELLCSLDLELPKRETRKMRPKYLNCPNCGAPVNFFTCEFCGTSGLMENEGWV